MLPELDWLASAKRLGIGQTLRIRHRSERRANMTVGNDRGHWWAYCQSCKEGARMDKEHVLLGGPSEAVERGAKLPIPNDRVRVAGSDYEATVWPFLASKGMFQPYLPEPWISPKQRRVLFIDGMGHCHGRDVTGRSNAKWIHYESPDIAAARLVLLALPTVIVTEDVFSMWKIAYAMQGTGLSIMSTMGAGVSERQALHLAGCAGIVWAYDADAAGDKGFEAGRRQMRAFVPKHYRARPPEGLDPKDMDIADIRTMIERSMQ